MAVGAGSFFGPGNITRAKVRPITGDPRVDADLYHAIDITNPFGYGSPKSYGGLVKQVGYGLNQAQKYRDITNNFRAGLGQNLAGGGFSSTQPFTSAINPNTAPTATSAGANKDVFDLVNVSKDPSGQFDRVNRGLLDQVENFKPDYTQARSTTTDVLNKLEGAQADVNANRADTDSLIAKFNALSPTLDKQTLDQTTALNRIYDPNGLKLEFAANTEAARNAERRAADLSIRQALFQNRLGSAGGAGSSYARAQLADATGRIGVETAARDADRRRQDTAALLKAQQDSLGKVQDLNTQNLLRSQIPIEARSRILDQEVNLALKRLQATGQAVTIDQMTDELTAVGRQLGLTGQALQNYLATNFFGVKKQGDDYPLYIDGGFGGGRVNPSYSGGPTGDDDGGYGPPRNQPFNYTPDWVKRERMRLQQPNPRYRPNTYNLTNDFSGYGDPRSPLYYPDYQGPERTRLLQDYYENPEKYPDGNPVTYGKEYLDFIENSPI